MPSLLCASLLGAFSAGRPIEGLCKEFRDMPRSQSPPFPGVASAPSAEARAMGAGPRVPREILACPSLPEGGRAAGVRLPTAPGDHYKTFSASCTSPFFPKDLNWQMAPL